MMQAFYVCYESTVVLFKHPELISMSAAFLVFFKGNDEAPARNYSISDCPARLCCGTTCGQYFLVVLFNYNDVLAVISIKV